MAKMDTVFVGTSADRSGGDVDMPLAAGEFNVVGNGAAGTASAWYPKRNGSIVQFMINSETAAATDFRFRRTDDPYWIHNLTAHLQTDPVYQQIINVCNYPVTTGNTIEADATNGGAVLDVAMYVLTSDGSPGLTTTRPMNLPPGTRIVEATGGTTLTADTVTEGSLTFVDFTPERDTRYKIVGMSAHGATLLFARLKYLEGPYEAFRPGVPASDTSTALEYQMFYGDFGEFVGQTPPNFEGIGVAGDTAQVFRFLLYPIGKK